eukprot:TRINITY_DN41_c0_g1_i1.p2 TRINITY_DN41_c0_g1~~TRINITY_DN41_c0_g1_i1.p2  ORF type:complete len:261 (-),score=79.52 TRINITY_DN41_c0_g1_i1:117-899(-)
MKVLLLVALLFVSAICADESSSVVVLTPENFSSTIASGIWVIDFYAPWCGHCRKLEPIWNQFADEAKKAGTYHVAKVDCAAHEKIADQYGIQGFPTIFLFKNGEKVDEHRGARDLDELKKFAEKHANPSSATEKTAETKVAEPKAVETKSEEPAVVLTSDNFDVNVKDDQTWLVKFYAPWCGHCKRLAPIWEELGQKVASDGGKFKVGKVDCTQNQALCQKYGIRGYPSVKLLQGGKATDYFGQRTIEAFTQFVTEKLSQ